MIKYSTKCAITAQVEILIFEGSCDGNELFVPHILTHLNSHSIGLEETNYTDIVHSLNMVAGNTSNKKTY